MATYYVDPAATGADDGSSWTDAFPTLQEAVDTFSAGDIVYARGTETIAAAIDLDQGCGTNAGGMIKIIGCNSSGVVDGTRYVIDGDGGNYAGINIAAEKHSFWFENIEVKNCNGGSNGYGFRAATWNAAYGCVYINCCGHNNYYGINGGNSLFFRCITYSNTSHGVYTTAASSTILCCASRDNGGKGFSISSGSTIISCISHGNTDDGYDISLKSIIINSVADGNGDNGVEITGTTVEGMFWAVLFSRITNHSGSGDIGLNANTENVVTGYNYFENNDGANIQNATLHQFIPIIDGSTTSNVEDQSNTNQGYVSTTSGSEDFSTNYEDSGDPDLRRTAITIPWS